MPYIKSGDRPVFVPFLDQIIRCCDDEDPILKGAYLGYYISLVKEHFIGSLERFWDFSKNLKLKFGLDREKLRLISQSVESIFTHIQRNSSLLAQAGEVNYVLSAVIWIVIGEKGSYGLRTYVKGCIWDIILNDFKNCHDMEKKHVIYGVLTDVIDENYRRQTADYEDSKILANGDIIPLPVIQKDDCLKVDFS